MRRAREDDLPTIMSLVDDVMRTRLMLPDPDLELTRLMVLHPGALLIADAETDAPLGGIRMFLHGDAVEFGYWLGADARGRGLATRALALVSAEIVARLQPSRLELRTTIGNEPSERVAERAGYTRVGREPPIEYPGGRITETTLWILEPVPAVLARPSSWTTRPSIPPATVTSSPLTWPERTSDERTTTWAAMSSGWATLRSAIVREMRRTAASSTRPRVIGDSVQPGATALTRASGADARDLVLQRQQQAALDGRLRGRVVGVPRLAEPARGRADEDERAVARAGDLAQERPRGEERGGQVLADRLLPARERELPHRQVDGRPDAGHRRAHVDRAELLARGCEQPVDVVLDRQVGLGDRRAADLGRHRFRPLLAAVVVHEHLRALGGEEPRAGGADSAGGTGDDDPFACETRFHEGVGYRQ